MHDLNFDVVVHALPFLWQGMKISVLLLVLAMLGGILLGTIIALVRLSAPKALASLAALYVNGLRSIPLIMVILWFYLLMPIIIGRPVGAFVSALVAFTLFEAAYYSEIIRAGIQSVSKGQLTAAQATGLSKLEAYRFVVLPQAFRNMAPVLLTQSIALFQDTSLVYVIGLHDFMTAAAVTANREGRLVELYVFTAIVYFVLCFAASRSVHLLKKRMVMP